MKIRNDYVSNSSSSSFIVQSPEAVKMFYDDFSEDIHYNCDQLGETFRVYLKKKHDGEDESKYWGSDYCFSEFCEELESGNVDFNDISKIEFSCDDWDSLGMTHLYFLYQYFKKFGFNPDASNSEHPISSDNGSFMCKILNRLESPIVKEEEKHENS